MPVDGSIWTWPIDYHKFRGRGPKATEKITGADGVVEFSLDGLEEHFTKSALFQAKNGRGDPRTVLEQVAKLRTWEEAAFFIRYEPGGYSAFDLEEAVRQAIHIPSEREVSLDTFLTGVFLACLIGDTELHHDPLRRELRWLNQDGRVVHTSFAIRHRLEIRVSAPRPHCTYRGSLLARCRNRSETQCYQQASECGSVEGFAH